MQRRRGFTLIELLVVVAIISILAAILFPVFAKAREKARQSACNMNLRQLSMGLMQYAQDYSDTLPNYYWAEGEAGNPWSATWFAAVYPYAKSIAVYECPTSPIKGHQTWDVWVWGPFADTLYTNNYGYNEIIGNWQGGLSLTRLSASTDTVLLADSSSSWIGGYWSLVWPDRAFLRRVAGARGGFACDCPPVVSSAIDWETYSLHTGGSNIAFADGHVKMVKATKVRTISGYGDLRYYENEW